MGYDLRRNEQMAATTASIPVSGLLASAFSTILGTPVATYEEYEKESPNAQFQPLDIDQIFRLSYDWATTEEEEEEKEGDEVAQSVVVEAGSWRTESVHPGPLTWRDSSEGPNTQRILSRDPSR